MTNTSRERFLYSFKYYFSLMKERQLKLWPAVFTGLFAALIGLCIPWFSKFFIDEVLINQNLQYAWPLLIIWFTFELLRFVGFSLRSINSYNLTSNLTVDIGIFILNKIHRSTKLIFKNYNPGVFIAHASDLENNCYTIFDILVVTSEVVIYLLALPLAFLIIDTTLALVVGGTVIMCVLSSLIASRMIKKLHAKRRYEEGFYSQKLISAIENAVEIRSYGLVESIDNEIHEQNHWLKELGFKSAIIKKVGDGINKVMFLFGSFVYRILTVYLYYAGKMTIGDFFAFNMVLTLLFSPIELLISLITPLREMAVNNGRVEALMDSEELINGKEMMPERGFLTLTSLSFSYNNDSKYAVNDFSFEFKPGVLYGIAGPNGAGKSSLLQLIARYYNPNLGNISFGGIPIHNIALKEYFSSVIYISTGGYVFPSSFNKNIILNKPYDERKFNDTITAFRITDLKDKFVKTADNCYISRNEVSLSSGEKQKIVIARAVYSDFKIYLFDEAFSYLDASSQAMFLQVLKNKLKNCVIVIASHDYRTLRHLDHLIYIENGRFAEQGPVSDMIAMGTKFSSLFAGATS